MRNSPGTKAQIVDEPSTRPIRSPIPTSVITKPATIRVFCVRRLANRSAPKDEIKMPAVAAVKMTPVLMALYPRTVCRKTETTNDVPMRSSHWMFWVTRARLHVRSRNSPVESSGSFPARSRARM